GCNRSLRCQRIGIASFAPSVWTDHIAAHHGIIGGCPCNLIRPAAIQLPRWTDLHCKATHNLPPHASPGGKMDCIAPRHTHNLPLTPNPSSARQEGSLHVSPTVP